MNNTDTKQLNEIYSEGIFTRMKARLQGVGNALTAGGSGSYNAGKAGSIESSLHKRIGNDITKFLKDVIDIDPSVKTLADWESKYPLEAQKVACMADAVSLTTSLTTKCPSVSAAPVISTPPPPPPPKKCPKGTVWSKKLKKCVKKRKKTKPSGGGGSGGGWGGGGWPVFNITQSTGSGGINGGGGGGPQTYGGNAGGGGGGSST